jgi:hypothetical protein
VIWRGIDALESLHLPFVSFDALEYHPHASKLPAELVARYEERKRKRKVIDPEMMK